MFNVSTLASRVRARRAELDLTQTEVAARASIAPSCLCSIERAKQVPGVDTLCAIATALGVTPDWLIGWDKAA